jgi:pantoate--beta-alanine ligase
MCEELLFPVKIVGAATSRETDGLARSSRNGFLSESERTLAPQLYALLQQVKTEIICGERNYRALESRTSQSLNSTGFSVDYITIANARTLAPAGPDDTDLIVAVAAKLGSTRLIDNISLAVVRDR